MKNGFRGQLLLVRRKLKSKVEAILSGHDDSSARFLGIEDNLRNITGKIEAIAELDRATTLDLLAAIAVMINLQHEQAATLQRLENFYKASTQSTAPPDSGQTLK